MKEEVLDIVRKMDLKDIETQLAIQCAPFLTGLKISNLFIIQKRDNNMAEQIMKKSDISYNILLTAGQRTTYLLYNREKLEEYLSNGAVTRLLNKMGYEKITLADVISCFRERYAAYMSGGTEFPHEMGLLLGYPVEDVEGFICNDGKNFLYAGYWKVYENPVEKRRLFDRFEAAQKKLIQLIWAGMRIEDIIGIYNNNSMIMEAV